MKTAEAKVLVERDPLLEIWSIYILGIWHFQNLPSLRMYCNTPGVGYSVAFEQYFPNLCINIGHFYRKFLWIRPEYVSTCPVDW